MNRAEWETTVDVAELARFAALRIPRRHLVLALSGLVRASLEGLLPASPSTVLVVAAVRAWCLHELDDDELAAVRRAFEQRELDEGMTDADEAAEFLIHLALWRTKPADPGASWGAERNPRDFAQLAFALVGLVLRSLRQHRGWGWQEWGEPAEGLRRRIAFPTEVRRDWVPQLPLIIGGAQVLTVVDWDIVHVAELGSPHALSPEALVLRDELLASAAPATEGQERERMRVEVLLAARGGLPAPPPLEFMTAVRKLEEGVRIGDPLMAWATPVERPDLDTIADRTITVGGLGFVGIACLVGAVLSVYDAANGRFWLDALEVAHGFFVLLGMLLLGAAVRVWRNQ